MDKIITFALNKGGVGKSTSAVTVAHKMALSDRKTLLVDFCPHGSCATLLGFNPAPGVAAFVNDPTATTFRNGLLDTGRGFDLLAGDAEIRRVERWLSQSGESIERMDYTLRAFFESYDVVVIDTHPGYWFQELALYMADTVVMVTALEFLALAEINDTLALFERVQPTRADAAPVQRIILPTMYRSNTVESKTNLAMLERDFPGMVAPAVPYLEAVKQCPSFGQTIWEYGPAAKSDAAVAYEELVVRWLWPTARDFVFGEV